MNWFLIALVAPFLWSLNSLVDKILINRFVSKEGSVMVLILYSSLFSFLVFPTIAIFTPGIFHIAPEWAILLVLAGFVEVTAIFLYLKALVNDDASTVVPFFQIVPIFSFVLGFFILGETLSPGQFVAVCLIIMGGMLLSLEFAEEKKTRFKRGLFALMVASSFCYALYDALFKLSGLETGFWVAVFWQHVGIAVAGLLLFLVAHYRHDFIENVRANKARVFALNFTNEFIYTVGLMVFSFSLLLAPIALVATVNVYHPIFTFALGLFFALFLPKLLSENLSLRHFLFKITAIAIIFLASSYLVQS